MEFQIKNSFDSITKNKIVKGAFHTFITSAVVAGTLALLSFLGQQDYGNPVVTMIVVQVSGMLYNTVKEYKSGE
ncbi:MAG: hypothetical protein CSYNP_03122 [Syntrophus sp. SKADARSKE-3]|nr:hypothetical protein [Syntrophus sp. SKADARSKE-3]